MLAFTRRAFAATALAAISIGLLGGAAAAQEATMKLTWNTSDGPKDPYAIVAHAFADEIQKRIPDAVKIQYYPNNQLGDEKLMMEGLRFGTIDAAIVTNALVATVEPGFQVVDMPFLFDSADKAHEVLDGEVGQQLLKSLDQDGIVGLGFAEGGFRHMINNVRPVNEPSDVDGVKFRVMQNPVFIDMFRSLGGNAVPIGWAETFTAAQQGTVDGLEIPLAVIASNKYSEVVKYLSLTKHTYSAIEVLVSKRFFDKLKPEQQTAMREAAKTAIDTQRQQVASNEKQMVETLKEQGMTVNDVTDVAAFREKVAPVYKEFRSSIGADLFDRTLEEAGAENPAKPK